MSRNTSKKFKHELKHSQQQSGGLSRPSPSHSCGKCKNPFHLYSPCVPSLYRTSSGVWPPLATVQNSFSSSDESLIFWIFFFFLPLLLKFIFLLAADLLFSASSCFFTGGWGPQASNLYGYKAPHCLLWREWGAILFSAQVWRYLQL